MTTKNELEPLLEASDIAKILKVSPRQVSERYAMRPNFPKAIRLPSDKGQGLYRWKKQDILNWIDTLMEAA